MHQLEVLDEIDDSVRDNVDEIVETVAQLGGVAEGTVWRIQTRTHLCEYPLQIHTSHEHLRALSGALAYFRKHTRKAIADTAALGADTSDIYTEVSRQTDKSLWFIEAFLCRKQVSFITSKETRTPTVL